MRIYIATPLESASLRQIGTPGIGLSEMQAAQSVLVDYTGLVTGVIMQVVSAEISPSCLGGMVEELLRQIQTGEIQLDASLVKYLFARFMG